MLAIRNISFKRGATRSLSHTILFQWIRSVSTGNIRFNNPNVLSSQPEKRAIAVTTVIKFFEQCGLDAAGAVKVEIRSAGFHKGGYGIDTSERLTVNVLDAQGNLMFWYRKSDQTFWNSIHVPADIEENEEIWERMDDYVRITEEQFRK